MAEKPTSIVSQQRFLGDAQCAEMISFAIENMAELAYRGDDTIFSGRFIDRPALPAAQAAARRAGTLLSLVFATPLALEVYQLVAWPEGTEQPVHTDRRRAGTTHAAIAYLNDDFEGGETFFPDIDTVVTPRRGTLIGFPGPVLPHGVRRITRGTRYTLALWFVPGPG